MGHSRNLWWKISFAGLFIFFLFCASLLFAEEIEEAALVPEGLSKGQYEKLLNQKDSLDKEREELLSEIEQLNADCSQVPASDKAKVKHCQSQHDWILKKIDHYEKRLQAYSTAILEAQKRDVHPRSNSFKLKGN